MKTNNLTIIAPEGMEAYQEGDEIRFRPIEKKLTYDDIAKELFYKKLAYYIADNDTCIFSTTIDCSEYISKPNNCTSKKQAKKLLAINQLMNVAKYLNGNWQPDWRDYSQLKYYIFIDIKDDIQVYYNDSYCISNIYFKSEELARQAVKILGEETIKLALSTDW